MKLVLLNQLVKIHRQQLERNTDMVSEREMFMNVNDICHVVRVGLTKMLQDPDFLLRLSVEALFIADHFQCHVDSVLVVKSMNDLAKTAFTNHLEDFVAVRNMIMWYLEQIHHTPTSYCM